MRFGLFILGVKRFLTSANLLSPWLLIVLFFFFQGHNLVSTFSRNLAHLVLNATLWQENQTAIERQKALVLAANLFEFSLTDKSSMKAKDTVGSVCSMIPSIVIAEHYRRQGNTHSTIDWLRRAAEAKPYPSVQKAILLPAWTNISPQGDISLGWSSPGWRFRHDSYTTAEAIPENEHGWLTLAYTNTSRRRDVVIYEWYWPIDLAYWHTLYLKAKVAEGTFLTVETSTSRLVRHLNYHQATNQWEDFMFSLENETELRSIYISLGEPSADPTVERYAADIMPLSLLLDASAGTCK